MKMLRKFQCWAKKKLSHEMTCVGKKSVAIEMEAFNLKNKSPVTAIMLK